MLDHGSTGWFVRGRYHQIETRVFDEGEEIDRVRTDRVELLGGGQIAFARRQTFQAGVGWGDVATDPGWGGALLAFRSQSLDANHRTLDAEWAVGDDGYTRWKAVVDHTVRVWKVMVTPGLRARRGVGRGPARRARRARRPALALRPAPRRVARAPHVARLAGAGAGGRAPGALVRRRTGGAVEEAVSGADLGPGAIGGFGIGAEVGLPIGPVRLEWGITDGGRKRVDFLLGTRF